MFSFIKRIIEEVNQRREALVEKMTPQESEQNRLENVFNEAIIWVWDESIARRFLESGKLTTFKEIERVLDFALEKEEECKTVLLLLKEQYSQQKSDIEAANLPPRELVAARKALPKTRHQQRQVELSENLVAFCRQKLHHRAVVEEAIAEAHKKIERREYLPLEKRVNRVDENDIHIEVTLQGDFDVKEEKYWIKDMILHSTKATDVQWRTFATKSTEQKFPVHNPYNGTLLGHSPRRLREGVRVVIVFA